MEFSDHYQRVMTFFRRNTLKNSDFVQCFVRKKETWGKPLSQGGPGPTTGAAGKGEGFRGGPNTNGMGLSGISCNGCRQIVGNPKNSRGQNSRGQANKFTGTGKLFKSSPCETCSREQCSFEQYFARHETVAHPRSRIHGDRQIIHI